MQLEDSKTFKADKLRMGFKLSVIMMNMPEQSDKSCFFLLEDVVRAERFSWMSNI